MTVDVDSPIFLLGMPRSGTTWLSQLFESSPDVVVRLSPPYAYDYRDKLDPSSGAEQWRTVLGDTIESNDRFVTQNWRRDTGELPSFDHDSRLATRIALKDTRFHELYLSAMAALPGARTIYIVRNPGATLWSWRQCKEFPDGADFAAEWRSGACRKVEGEGEYWGFDDWLAVTTDYRRRAAAEPDRYLVVRYEDMVTSALATVERMFSFCGLGVPASTGEFVRDSQSRFDPRPYSVFKGAEIRDDWRHELPADIYATIERETIAAGLADYLS